MKNIALTVILLIITGTTIWAISSRSVSQNENEIAGETEIVIYKNEACECCNRWADYLEKHGYKVSVQVAEDMVAIKENNHMPLNLASCHTALVDGYVVEGHVPAEDINRLLTERPEAVGLTAPGMPASSPGMDIPTDQTYEVLLIDSDGNSTAYATH